MMGSHRGTINDSVEEKTFEIKIEIAKNGKVLWKNLPDSLNKKLNGFAQEDQLERPLELLKGILDDINFKQNPWSQFPLPENRPEFLEKDIYKTTNIEEDYIL